MQILLCIDPVGASALLPHLSSVPVVYMYSHSDYYSGGSTPEITPELVTDVPEHVVDYLKTRDMQALEVFCGHSTGIRLTNRVRDLLKVNLRSPSEDPAENLVFIQMLRQTFMGPTDLARLESEAVDKAEASGFPVLLTSAAPHKVPTVHSYVCKTVGEVRHGWRQICNTNKDVKSEVLVQPVLPDYTEYVVHYYWGKTGTPRRCAIFQGKLSQRLLNEQDGVALYDSLASTQSVPEDVETLLTKILKVLPQSRLAVAQIKVRSSAQGAFLAGYRTTLSLSFDGFMETSLNLWRADGAVCPVKLLLEDLGVLEPKPGVSLGLSRVPLVFWKPFYYNQPFGKPSTSGTLLKNIRAHPMCGWVDRYARNSQGYFVSHHAGSALFLGDALPDLSGIRFRMRVRKKDAFIMCDPYSTARYLAENLAKREDIVLCALTSDNCFTPFYVDNFETQLFKRVYVLLDNNIEKMYKKIAAEFNIKAVVGSMDSGAYNADYIAEAAGCLANGTALSLARRDKFLMHERLRKCNVPCSTQDLVDTEEEAVKCARATGFPVVVKPVDSGGSDGVSRCNDDEAVRQACRNNFGRTMLTGAVADKLIVQNFLEGEEQIWDTCSYNGKHGLMGVWVPEKARGGGDFTYRNILLKEWTRSPSQVQTFAYVCLVLDALGVRYGPVHMELIVGSKGPCLIECGTRMPGAEMPRLLELGCGSKHSHHYYSEDVYCNFGMDTQALIMRGDVNPYKVQKHTLIGYLTATGEGKMAQSPEAFAGKTVAALDSYQYHKFSERDEINLTTNLIDTPGFFVLSHPSLTTVERDYNLIDRLQEAIFSFLPDAPSQNQHCILVVDPPQFGNLLEEFNRRGRDILGVFRESPGKQPYEGVSWNLSVADFEGGLSEMVRHIQSQFKVEALLNGGFTSSSLVLSTELAQRLNMKLQNSAALADCWDDENFIHVNPQLAKNGLKAPVQQVLDSHGMEDCEIQLPAMIKPVNWRGNNLGQRLGLVHDMTWRRVDSKNVLESARLLNSQAGQATLVRELLSGDLFDLELVSYHGQHLVCGSWKHMKNPDHCMLVDYDACPPKVYEYAQSVVKALGIEHGPSWLSVRVTWKGPILHRFYGGFHPASSLFSSSKDEPAFLCADIYTNKGRYFRRKFKQVNDRRTPPYEVNGTCLRVNLCIEDGMPLSKHAQKAKDLVINLPTYRASNFMNASGVVLTEPEYYFFLKGDRDSVMSDLSRFREFEEKASAPLAGFTTQKNQNIMRSSLGSITESMRSSQGSTTEYMRSSQGSTTISESM